MKNRLILLILLALCVSCKPEIKQAPQSNLNWQTDLNVAMSMAKKSNQKIIAAFSTEWCPYCKFMDEKIFNQSEVSKKLEEFVLLKLDGDKSSSQTLMDKYNIKGFPTFIILTAQGKEVSRFNDINSKEEMLKALEDKETKKETKPTESEEEHYKKLADESLSKAVKKMYLIKAKEIIENKLDKIADLNGNDAWSLLDQDIELLVDIYKGIGEYEKIKEVYINAASELERLANKNGGIENNLYIIPDVVYYYISAGKPASAIKFLNNAMKSKPDYWPIYSSYAKTLIADGKPKEAIEYAKKGYSLAEEIAKPKAALIWAEAYASMQNYADAANILKMAESDLSKTGSIDKGRAKNVLGQLKKQETEYRSLF